MPVYLRTFYFGKLSETKKKENEEIKKAQKNPYGGNPYMLCLFEFDSKKIELWISSTILHNLYSVMFDTFVSQNLIFNYCPL